MSLGAKVIEINFVDDAAHATVNFARRGRRIVAITHANDSNAPVFKPTHDALLLDHVARESIQTLYEQDIEAAGIGINEHAGAARASIHRGRTRHRLVAIFSDDMPTLAIK